jgi:hypothetical protein
MNKSKIYKRIYDILNLPSTLIEIIYGYARQIIEVPGDIIPFYDNTKFSPREMTILGNHLFVLNAQNKFYVFDADTHKLIHPIKNLESDFNNTTLNDHIKEYLTSPLKNKNYSGYCPYFRKAGVELPSNDPVYALFKNFWYTGINERTKINKFILTNDNVISYNSTTHDIEVYEKKTMKYIQCIDEEYEFVNPESIKIYAKNIISYDNILYIACNIWYVTDDIEETYVHLYDIKTFEFIKELYKESSSTKQTAWQFVF